MQLITPFNSILAAIQYKNFFKSVNNDLKNNEILKIKGFENFLENLPPNYGIQVIRVPVEKKQLATLTVGPLRVQYEELGIIPENIQEIVDLLNGAGQKRNALVPSTEKDNVEFVGIIIEAHYSLIEEEIEKLKAKIKWNDLQEIKSVEKKHNYKDKDDWNHNVIYSLDFVKKIFVVRYDVNDRYKKTQGLCNLGEIVKIIRAKIESLSIDDINL